jgi:hypothetical protein
VAHNVSDWVWKNSRSVNAGRLVLLAIAHDASRDGITAMSVSEIAAKAHLGDRTVQCAIKDLVHIGEVTVRPKLGEHARNGYQVTMNRGADPAPLRTVRGADPAPLAPEKKNPRGADPAPLKPSSPSSTLSTPQILHPLEKTDVFTTSTGRSEVPVKEVSAISRQDVEQACRHLADRIEANGSKRPVIGKRWRDAARLMLDKDGRTEQQLSAAIDWCQDHEFWRANIMSMPKLREKYDQLRLQASQKPRQSGRQAETNQLFDRAYQRAQQRENGIDPHGNGDTHQVRPRSLPASGDR